MRPKPLLYAIRIPGKVIVDHQVSALEVDAFRGRIVGQKNLHLRVVQERLLDSAPFLSPDTPVDHDHRLLATQEGYNTLAEVVEGVPVLGKDDEFFGAETVRTILRLLYLHW